MMISFGIISAILLILLGISIWYIRGLLILMYQLTSDIEAMQDELEEFSKHLNNVYEMEIYYGDETLQQLIRHSKDIIDNINAFKNLFVMENDDKAP
jgi:hypothetical protein|tara:strand:- start:944 stop:1234 length:291 start_codon:yes stop_codon:yes gene_type:complete